jgi:TDG/mug DNA glycosylase family protein
VLVNECSTKGVRFVSWVCQGFEPIIPDNPTVLILGTMPSVASLEKAFYYAHPRNVFWPIMQTIIGQVGETNIDKAQVLQKHGVFLWDVLQACERKGSLDSAIKQPEANDFEWVFLTYPNLKVVAFNGKAAEKLFNQHVIKNQRLPNDLTYLSLPSTSPANAQMTFDDKVLLWQEKLTNLL